MKTSTTRFLIIDDSKSIREVIRRYLAERIDGTFLSAGNGEEAEVVLQENQLMGTPIEIIILDWMMPKVTGFEFLKKIRGTELFANNPTIVMLSAETYPEQIEAAMKYNVAAYVKKPFTQEDLVSVVTEILSKRGLKNAV